MKIIYCVLVFYIFGTYMCQNNEEDGTIRMFLRGRPVIPYEPSDQEPLNLAKVAPPPQNKLTLDWMNGDATGDFFSGDSNGNIIWSTSGLRANSIDGTGNIVSGNNNTIIGNDNTVSGFNNTVIGNGNAVSGSNHEVIGDYKVVSG